MFHQLFCNNFLGSFLFKRKRNEVTEYVLSEIGIILVCGVTDLLKINNM